MTGVQTCALPICFPVTINNGTLTDDELINSCPSRYVQTASEKMSYLKELAAKDKEVRDKAAAAAKDKEEKEKAEKENAEFQSRLLEIFK